VLSETNTTKDNVTSFFKFKETMLVFTIASYCST